MSTRPYATGTKTPIEKTLQDLKKTLGKYGIKDFAQAERQGFIHIMFAFTGSEGEQRSVRFSKRIPDREELRVIPISKGNQFGSKAGTKTRTDTEIDVVLEAETRRIYRALNAVILGRLIGIDEGIEPMEQVFYSETVATPTGETVYEATSQRMVEALKRGQLPSDLLPHLPRIVGRAVIAALPGTEQLEGK